MCVRHQELALEFAEHAHEARLIPVIKFAAGEFQLGDNVDAHDDPHLAGPGGAFRSWPRRSIAKLLLFLLSEGSLRRRPAFVPGLAGVSRPVPMRFLGIVTRFPVKRWFIRAL